MSVLFANSAENVLIFFGGTRVRGCAWVGGGGACARVCVCVCMYVRVCSVCAWVGRVFSCVSRVILNLHFK